VCLWTGKHGVMRAKTSELRAALQLASRVASCIPSIKSAKEHWAKGFAIWDLGQKA
jgi:hypothetical protein